MFGIEKMKFNETFINLIRYNKETKKFEDYDTENKITHVFGLDFNSLYPSAFSSAFHKFNPYIGGKMYMPGKIIDEYDLTKTVVDKKDENFDFKTMMTKQTRNKLVHKCKNIINQKNSLFIASLKGYIPEENFDKCSIIAPIFRNLEIETTKEVIGEYMFDYMKNNGLTVNNKEFKLTTLLSTHGKYMSFSSYYLWFLIDNFGFVIEDINYFITFDKHDRFNNFVTTFMKERIEKGILEKNIGLEMLRKIALNGSYGYDIVNEENFTNVQLCDASQTITAHMKPTFRSERKIKENVYQVNSSKKSFNCNTPIQEGFFTLDNAKFWYLNFLYNFVFKCVDKNRFHLIEGDTDSIYFAVSGDTKKDAKQGFSAIITDQKFYDENYKYFLPNEDLKNASVREKKYDEKKILGCAVEKFGYSAYALAPKCYTIFQFKNREELVKNNMKKMDLNKDLNKKLNELGEKRDENYSYEICKEIGNFKNQMARNEADKMTSDKIKGTSLYQNSHINGFKYKEIIQSGKTVRGKNTLLTLKSGKMSKIVMNKYALSAAMTKMIVQPNGACLPFLYNP